MEEASGGKARESGGSGDGTLLVIVAIAVIFFAATTVAFGYFVVFGESLSPGPGNVYTLTLREYEIEPSPDPIIAKVGETLVFRIVNEGSVEHEVMFVLDLEMMANMIEMRAMELMQERPDLSQEEIAHIVLEEHDEVMLRMVEQALGDKVKAEEYMIELEPGESEVISMTFLEPGIYIIACMELSGTFPKPHAASGMFNQIIVVEG